MSELYEQAAWMRKRAVIRGVDERLHNRAVKTFDVSLDT
jgi:hypothetical protein